MSIFISLVSFNSDEHLASCLKAIAHQQVSTEVHVSAIDNGSDDNSVSVLREVLEEIKTKGSSSIFTHKELPFTQNFGFSGAHNINAARFLVSKYEYFLVINPDVKLSVDALDQFVTTSKRYSDNCIITPKLFRQSASQVTSQIKDINEYQVLDAAGMILNKELRHFDRGSDCKDSFFNEEEVFGGTGACLFIPKNIVKKLLLKGASRDKDLFKIFPQLETLYDERAPLFDEGFFAYREDADLCWRANHLGIKTIFSPSVTGTHVRKVLPTNRKNTSIILNGLSVRNRFLLQISNYWGESVTKENIIHGFIIRNILVLLGVCLKETSSLPYLFGLVRLLPRAFERRRLLKQLKSKL
jgi:GT2 family glycosyltransferase